MKYKFNTIFYETDFTREQMTDFENKIAANTKIEERVMGTTFIFKGIIFLLDTIIFNFDDDTKYIQIKQITTKSKILKPN